MSDLTATASTEHSWRSLEIKNFRGLHDVKVEDMGRVNLITGYDRLNAGGVLSVSRWYQIGTLTSPLETYRVASLASQALKN